ncbi:MAG: glycosyltransferase family 2 protein [Myxococcota bacterium]|nr:glycosyltransferase family 2 protein [Myxococcota bacterium]
MAEAEPSKHPSRHGPISVLIPVYNEVENLRDLQREITLALDEAGIEFEVILVNDGSSDGSTQLLDEIHADDPRFRVVHFIQNYGQTAAMKAGIQHASNEILVSMDADLQNDPRDIPQMLEQLDDYDLVCGWRKKREDNFILRKVPSKCANLLISRTTGVRLHDYGCTLKVYRREYVEDIELYGQMHRFIPIYVTWAGARIVEVPVNHRARTKGSSKYGITRTFRVILDLMTTVFLRDFYSNPLYFFGYYGFGAIALGFLFAAWAVVTKYTTDPMTYIHKNPMVPLAALFVLLGFNSFFFGLLAEVLIRMNFAIQKKEPYRVRQVRGLEAKTPLIGRSQTPDDPPVQRVVATQADSPAEPSPDESGSGELDPGESSTGEPDSPAGPAARL